MGPSCPSFDTVMGGDHVVPPSSERAIAIVAGGPAHETPTGSIGSEHFVSLALPKSRHDTKTEPVRFTTTHSRSELFLRATSKPLLHDCPLSAENWNGMDLGSW